MLNENDFFKEATLRICGSLDISTAMERTFQYLRDFLPLDSIGFYMYEPDHNVMRLIARVGILDKFAIGETTSPPETPIHLDRLTKIIRHPEHNPIIKGMLRNGLLSSSEISVILLRLTMEDGNWGTLFLSAKGTDKYTAEHEYMLSLLNGPFTITMANALKHRQLLNVKNRLVDDNRYLQDELRSIYGSKIIGQHSGFKSVMAMVRQVAPLNSPVLLLGETGVGKDVVANAIHYSSLRKYGPFVKVNCGAIPDTLLDSELFGHEKGAFTGAIAQKRGRFERAHEGTIFLDEVGELLPQAQVRMLRVLQEKEIERIGGASAIPVDIRLIAATNRNLEEMTETNYFRKDLWFRLNVFPILIPPLRERKEDIPEFVEYFLEKKSSEMKRSDKPVLAAGAIDLLMDYRWPGNVRELENIMERALILNRGEPLTFESLLLPGKMDARGNMAQADRVLLPLDRVVVRHIQTALHATKGKIHGPGGAAEILGINPSTLRTRMKKLGIPHHRNN